MVDLNKRIPLKDRQLISEDNEIPWIPKDPQKVLLPYQPTEKELGDLTDIENRRKKANEVVDGYDKIIKDCEELENTISETCKDVSVPISAIENKSAFDAIRRIFGIDDPKEITFEMYKVCVQEFAKLNDNLKTKP